MKTDAGVRVRTSAEIDVDCSVDYEITGKETFFSFADGAVSLHFTDDRAFKKFMGKALDVLAALDLDRRDATVDVDR